MRGHLSPQDEGHNGSCRAQRKLSARVERCLWVARRVCEEPTPGCECYRINLYRVSLCECASTPRCPPLWV